MAFTPGGRGGGRGGRGGDRGGRGGGRGGGDRGGRGAFYQNCLVKVEFLLTRFQVDLHRKHSLTILFLLSGFL